MPRAGCKRWELCPQSSLLPMTDGARQTNTAAPSPFGQGIPEPFPHSPCGLPWKEAPRVHRRHSLITHPFMVPSPSFLIPLLPYHCSLPPPLLPIMSLYLTVCFWGSQLRQPFMCVRALSTHLFQPVLQCTVCCHGVLSPM